MENPESLQNEDSVASNLGNSPQIERAIIDAQYLVEYTAKAGKEVDQEILNTLIIAKTKWDSGKWSNEFAVQFWDAFRQMNQLIKPATVSSVRAIWLEPKQPGFRGYLKNQYGRSEASQTITRYTLWTVGVLFFVLFFQIYWVVGNSLTIRLKELLNNEIELTNAINQANSNYSDIEVLFKLKEEEGKDGQVGASYEFYYSPDWERETLHINAERQRLETELEALKTQLERNSDILLRWSIGWQWIFVKRDDIHTAVEGAVAVDAKENKAGLSAGLSEIDEKINDLKPQIGEAEALIDDTKVKAEIENKRNELAKLEEKLAKLDSELVDIVNQAQTMDTPASTGEGESGTLQVNVTFEQTANEKKQVLSDIAELRTWLGQPDLEESIKTQRQANLNDLKAEAATLDRQRERILVAIEEEAAALARQLKREVIKEESRRVRLSTEFALIILQSYILPVLYGLLGASVYVLRTITREISNVTFSEESNFGYLLRLALGTLAGLIIGWFVFLLPGQSIVSSISPMALAFLVGYNIEIVFSLMDRVIAMITKPDEDGPVSPTTPDERQKNGENQTKPESPATV